MSIEAMKLARSVISSINQGKQHALTMNNETVYWQREEWVRWALDEVLPVIDQAIERPAQQEQLTGGDERRHIICLCPDCTKPAQQQEPVAKLGMYEHKCPNVTGHRGPSFVCQKAGHGVGQNSYCKDCTCPEALNTSPPAAQQHSSRSRWAKSERLSCSEAT